MVKQLAFLLIGMALLAGCTNRAYRAQKKLNKVVAKYPELQRQVTDTLRDTLYIAGKTLTGQTTIKTLVQTDTVRLTDTLTQVKVKLAHSNGNVSVLAECPNDTVYIEKPFTYNQVQLVEDFAGLRNQIHFVKWAAIAVLALLALMVVVGVVKGS